MKQTAVNEIHLETTSIDNGHIHTYAIDEFGVGETLKTIVLEGDSTDHIHKIENFNVLEADGHIHRIRYTEEVEEIEQEKKEEKIKEISIILNTGEEGFINFLTEKINGKLGSIIIESESQINIKITLEGYDDVVIYEKQSFFGQKYLSLKNDSTFSNNEKAQSNGSHWILNDRLKIHISGVMNTPTSLSIRYI